MGIARGGGRSCGGGSSFVSLKPTTVLVGVTSISVATLLAVAALIGTHTIIPFLVVLSLLLFPFALLVLGNEG